MKMIIIIMTALLVQASAAGLAQNVTYVQKNASLEQIFTQIRKQTGYDVLVPAGKLNINKKIDANFKQASLENVMTKALENLGMTYGIDEKTIVIKPEELSLLDKLASVIQSVTKGLTVRGVVKDQDGKPLPNASIRIKGKNTVINTNQNGEFEIKGVADDAVLLVSYVGFKTLELPLKDAVMPLEIKLNVATGELEEVKVVYNTGYQELNKERATGSFVQIDNELFNRRVGSKVLERINELVPGMLNLGPQGGSPLNDYRIRGESTFTANKQPLLVVDNFIYEGDPDQLNPNNVESITILKDAAAASIYGARAGNGVIVVTMKKGRVNAAPAISFNSNLTIGQKPDLFAIPVVSAADVIALERKRFAEGYYDGILNNTTSFPAVSPIVEILARQRSGAINATQANAQIEMYEQHDIRKDVNKYLLQTAVAQQYSLGISGGTNNYRYYGSAGYDRSRPNDINMHNDRLTINFSNTWNPVKNLEINVLLNWNTSKNQNNNNLLSYNKVMTSPYELIADENGNSLAAIPSNEIRSSFRMIYVDTVNFPGKLDWLYRPLEEAGNGNRLIKNSGININGSVNYTLTRGLKINLGYSWQSATGTDTKIDGLNTFATRDLINRFVQKGANNLPVYPYPLGAQYARSNSEQTAWTWRGGLNFSRSFSDHDITSIVGIEARESKTSAFGLPTLYGYNQETNIFGTVQPGTWITRPGGTTQVIAAGIAALKGTLNRFCSYYGNIGYTLKQRYTFTASGRIDESNFFGVETNDRKKPLWSAGIKWDLSEESFYKLSLVPVLSLRATYGYSGNVNAGTSPFATVNYNSAASPLFIPYAVIGTPPNPELKWENVRTINFALDFGMKNQRIFGSLEFYHKRSEDLLSDITVAPSSGFAKYKGNSSSMQTRGIDLSLGIKNLDGLLKWQSTLNFAYQQDKVVSYTVAPPKFAQFGKAFIIGKPLSAIYSYHWAGLNPLTGDAQLYVNDQIVGSSSSSKAQQNDVIYNGRIIPPIFGNFRTDFSFKDLSVSIGLSYQFGHYFRRQSFAGILGSSTIGGSWVHQDYLKAWKLPGDELTTNVPGFLNSYPDNRFGVYGLSDILIEKRDYIRLQDIRLSYNLTKSNFKKLLFKDISLYAYANNLGIIWKASKYNPDTQNGLATTTPKTFALGLNANF